MVVLLALSLAIFAAVMASVVLSHLPPKRQPVALSTRRSLFWLSLAVVLASPLWLAGLQLYPVSAEAWSALPGRLDLLNGLGVLGGNVASARPLSLNPSATAASLWAGVPVAAALLVGVLANARQTRVLFGVMIGVAAVQGAITVIQYVQGPGSLLYFDTAFPSPMIGSFNNRNHLANLFVMAIPLWFAVWAHWHRDGDEGAKVPMFVLPLWYLLGFGILILLLSTQSRGGLLAGGVALVLSVLVYALRVHTRLLWRHWLALGALAAVFGMAAALSVGEDKVTERFAREVITADAEVRGLLAASTFDAAWKLWPWGSGAGTYESVFPRFQSALSPGYASYAHNDYAQLLMEFGAAGVLVGGLLAVLAVVQLGHLVAAGFRHGGLGSTQLQQCFAGVALLAFLIHCWVEFNMHIPALAIVAAMLAGVFLQPTPRDGERGR